MQRRVIVYGLGKKFAEKKGELISKFDVIGYSDQNKETAEKLEEGEIFIPVEEFLSYDFHMIIICGGGISAKNSIFYKLMDNVRREDIVLIEDIDKINISKDNFEKDLSRYKETNCHKNFNIKKEFLYPIVNDIGEDADRLDGHYFMQDICVAKKILEDNPEHHYDIGSRVDGFISHLLVFRESITLIDVRPFPHRINGLRFIQSNAVDLAEIQDESIESLSCLHAAEHFGLGRYGDDVDAEAFFTAMKNFERVLKKGGKLYLSVPCGKEDIVYFNAHRMFYPLTVIEAFDNIKLLKFEIISNYQIKEIDINNEAVLKELGNYYCGIFTLQK